MATKNTQDDLMTVSEVAQLFRCDQRTPRFVRDQPVWWQRTSSETPLEAKFAYYTKVSGMPVIDVLIRERYHRKFVLHDSLSERIIEDQSSEREQLL